MESGERRAEGGSREGGDAAKRVGSGVWMFYDTYRHFARVLYTYIHQETV